jgi:hypothetical protein
MTSTTLVARARSRLASARQRVAYGPSAGVETYQHPVLLDMAGNKAIKEALGKSGPLLVARIGANELRCVSFFSRWRRMRRFGLRYPRHVGESMFNNAGFFPSDDAQLDRFASEFLASVADADVMAVWFQRNEHRVIRDHCPEARLVHLASLEPWFYTEPWSAELAGRTVLVVHPFARSIEAQYRDRRERLFPGTDVLPDFELKTLRAVWTAGGCDAGFKSWFDAFAHMCDQISHEEYDVALIGAGAYGLPLGAFVKSQGKQAVHMGGDTQILFGIKGRRWEEGQWYREHVGELFNDSWVRPLPEETPKGADAVEGGCYW